MFDLIKVCVGGVYWFELVVVIWLFVFVCVGFFVVMLVMILIWVDSMVF